MGNYRLFMDQSRNVCAYTISSMTANIGGWSRTLAVIKAYGDEEHDFGIDVGVVSSLTALNIDESKSLMKSLAKSDSGM
jgi:hypothetical protein